LKIEFFGDQFAKQILKYNCSTETLIVAKHKVNYFKKTEIKL
jgi:hypothetical protein